MGLVGNAGITGTSPEPRKPNGGIKMRLNWKPMIVALAAVALVRGGSALASPSPSADSSAIPSLIRSRVVRPSRVNSEQS